MYTEKSWTIKRAKKPGVLSVHDDGTQYYYLAGPDRKGQMVMIVAGHDYYQIVQERFINKVLMPSNAHAQGRRAER